MSELAALAQALASIKVASDIAQGLVSVDRRFREADLKGKIADLAEALAEARLAVVQAQEEIEALQRRNRELEAMPDLRANFEQRGNLYYLRAPQTGLPEGPFCVICYERGNLVPVARLAEAFRVFGEFSCPVCKTDS